MKKIQSAKVLARIHNRESSHVPEVWHSKENDEQAPISYKPRAEDILT